MSDADCLIPLDNFRRGRRGFAIMNLKTKSLVVHVEDEERTYVGSFAWAPESRHLAVLKNARTSQFRRPRQWLSLLMGHPLQYYRAALAIYTAAGQLVARSSLSPDEKRSGADEVVWFNGC